MKQLTTLYGSLVVRCGSSTYEIVVEPKNTSVLFPVTPNMTQSEIVNILSNRRVLTDSDNIELLSSLTVILSDIRTTLFDAIKTSEAGLVVNRELIKLNRSQSQRFHITSIGDVDSKEDAQFFLPSGVPVKISLQTFPEPFHNTNGDLCVIQDYIAAHSDGD